MAGEAEELPVGGGGVSGVLDVGVGCEELDGEEDEAPGEGPSGSVG